MLNNNNIKIAMLEMSPQSKAILEFYFDRAGKGLYSVVSEDKADAFIIDYDQFGAKEHVSEILTDRKLPILLISIREQSIPSTVWVAKPLSADALNKAAVSVKELMVAFEEQAKALKAEEAKTAKTAKQEHESVEVLTDMHIEEEESLLDDSFKEFDDAIENTTSEKLLEIDEMALEEKTPEKNKAVDSGLAIAGVAASALVASTLVTTEDANGDDNDNDLFDFDQLETENNTDDSLSIELEEVSNKATNIEVEEDLDNDNDVDSLLDSLILEDDKDVNDDSVNNENQLIEDVSKIDEEDAFLDNLLSEQELEKTIENNLETSPDLDVLKSVDSQLEGNIDLQKSLNTDDTNNNLTVENSGLVDEDFTLHDDLDPSTEDVFANTLEIDYAEVKTNEQDATSKPIESLNGEFEALNVDTNNLSTDQENITETGLDETLDSDFNFDFEASEAETNEIAATESEGDFELTLLDDADVASTDEENTETSSIEDVLDTSLDDDLDTDLDNLLQEVSGGSDEVSKELENNLQPELEIETVVDETNTEANTVLSADEGDLGDDLSDTDLQSLLNEVREEATSTTSGLAGGSNSESAYEQTEAEKRWMQLCGNEDTIKNQKEVSKITFDPKKHLLGVVLEQINTPKDVEHLFRLKYQDLIIVIDHSQSKVYCNTHLTSDEYSVFCFNEVDPEKVKIHDLDYSEERLYRSKIEKNPRRAHSFESFIWTTSLLTSRGRLPENTNVTKSVGLKTWPNLTRLESIPDAMNMAAVFAKNPGTLLEIPKWLNIQQRYVFAFYNACLSLDMIELDSNKLKKSGFSFGKKTSDKKSEERGFFGRLLKRLKT